MRGRVSVPSDSRLKSEIELKSEATDELDVDDALNKSSSFSSRPALSLRALVISCSALNSSRASWSKDLRLFLREVMVIIVVCKVWWWFFGGYSGSFSLRIVEEEPLQARWVMGSLDRRGQRPAALAGFEACCRFMMKVLLLLLRVWLWRRTMLNYSSL